MWFIVLFRSVCFVFYILCLNDQFIFESRVLNYPLSSVQSLSRVWLFVTPWIAACQASLSITNSRSSPRLTSIESVMPSSHLMLCCPLLLLPPNPSKHQHQSLFQWINSSPEVAKVLDFSFSIIPSKEIPGLISFRIDWLDLLAVQGTLQEASPTPQFKSINSSVLILHGPTLTSIPTTVMLMFSC